MKAIWSAAQIQGARDYQEDFFAVVESDLVYYQDQEYELEEGDALQGQTLVILADGMGGMGHGDLAAAQIIENFIKFYLMKYQDTKDIGASMLFGMRSANKVLVELVAGNPEYQGMGATLIALLWDESTNKIYWLSVGDSMLYLYPQCGEPRRLNEKHTWSEQTEKLADQISRFSEQELADIKDVLCSAVDGSELEMYDLQTEGVELASGDCVLVASDGLETLSLDAIEKRVCSDAGNTYSDNPDSEKTEILDLDVKVDGLSQAVAALIEDVEAAGQPRQDNATVILLGSYQGADSNTNAEKHTEQEAAAQ